jgi:alginate O-acetyltransferase complex protein AlgI
MQFDSPIFFLGFLPVAIALIFLSTRRYSNVAIIILSLIFYTWGEPKFALIVVASAVFDCTVARRMYWVLQSSSPHYRKLLLLVMVLGNICLLVYHKGVSDWQSG